MLLKQINQTPCGKAASNWMRNFYYSSFLLLFLLLAFIPYASSNWDPYEILGVRRDASQEQVKKAYREMARKLHPDKSNLNEEESGRKFIELNKAFSILKDPERRSRYNSHGDTEENRHSRGFHDPNQRRHRHTQEYWTHNGYRTFTFFTSSDGHFRRNSITTKQYHNEYLKDSRTKPFFIFFYSDSCPSCNFIESTWIKITDELAKYNIGSFTINVHQEWRLSQELGISSIPQIACLIDGQIKTYHQSELSLASIVKFTKNVLPNNLVTLLKTESEQDRYITLGPQLNRLSAIIMNNESNLKLRYLLMAYELRQHYRFGHISSKLSTYSLFAKKYNLAIDPQSKHTHILVFNENIDKPTLNINFEDDNFDLVKLRKHFLKWPFLQLPRLSSQQRFDDLCLYTIPRDADKTKTRICVILFATETPSSFPSRSKLMEFIELNQLSKNDNVVFTYLDPFKQADFVKSLLVETADTYPFKDEPILNSILLVERNPQSNRKAHYKWLAHRWDPKNLVEIDIVKLELHKSLTDYQKNSNILVNKVALNLLVDEEGPSLMDRIFWRFVDDIKRMVYYVASRESLSTIIILAVCALITSLFLYQTPASGPMPPRNPYEPSNRTNQFKESRNDSPAQNGTSSEDLKLIELKAETYNGMIRLLKPGYRSIVLLGDRESKDKLLPKFRRAVWPYRRNKTLLFGYLCLDKNLDWYKSLLQDAIGVDDLRVNKKNCIGTVLSLNGFKKYFRVYHAKHHEIDYYDNETDNDGSFLGFDEDNEADIEKALNREGINDTGTSKGDTVCTVDNLLDRLPIWLDKMFDGLTKRYSLDRWPEEMN